MEVGVQNINLINFKINTVLNSKLEMNKITMRDVCKTPKRPLLFQPQKSSVLIKLRSWIQLVLHVYQVFRVRRGNLDMKNPHLGS